MNRERWRFIYTPNLDPAMNMAIDEALMISHANNESLPTLRFYTWIKPTLSIGYFQKASKEIDFNRVKNQDIGFVRRPTGGRAVLHDHELTYSVVIQEKLMKNSQSVIEAYHYFSMGLLNGFRNLGLNAKLVSLTQEKEKYESLGSSACFDSPSWYELVVEGKKVAGSAQTRINGVIMQHGSILLDLDSELLFSLLKFSSERIKERMLIGFKEKAIAINDLLQDKVTLEQVIRAFKQGFVTGLNIELIDDALTEKEWEMAKTLVKERYGSDEWNLKR